MNKEFGDGLNQAVAKAFTRPAPKSAGAQMRYLVKQYKGTKAVAQMLRVSQRTVERYVKDQIKKPRPDLAARLEREVKARWQPQIRAKAKEKAATTGGIVIDVHARLGYAGAPMDSTDEDRIRHLTVALPPQHAARLFDAQEQGATEDRLRELTAEALKEVYFQDSGRRAGSLQEVQINDVLDLGFQL
ncbi:XRE family transcriptional regulator [Streptomyces sp. Edi4]|uniref:telomere-protecting terminal protein Tpg n=1 Tax=Streptomyces sp. Edi4 TaxID=3162527 RepID=UPI00330644C7